MSSKELFVVRVDNYFPALCEISLPSLERYANKIGAKFTVITERKFPEFPPHYEKMQIHELGKDNDVNILFDCDIAVREEMYDVSEMFPEGYVGTFMVFPSHLNFIWDEYLICTGNEQGIVSNMVATRREQHALWTPLEFSYEEAKKRLVTPRPVDEYCISRNAVKHRYPLFGMILPGSVDNLFMHCDITTNKLNEERCLQELKDFLTE